MIFLNSHFRNETGLSNFGVSAFSLNRSRILLLGYYSYLGSWYCWHSDEPMRPMISQVASTRLWSEYYLSNRMADLFHKPFGSKARNNGKKKKKSAARSSAFFKASSSYVVTWFRLSPWVCVEGGSHSLHTIFLLRTAYFLCLLY